MNGLSIGQTMPALLFGKTVYAVVVEVCDYGNRIALSVLPSGLDSPKTVFTCRFSLAPTEALADGVAYLEHWFTRDGRPFGSWYESNAMARLDFVPGGVCREDEVERKS